MKNTFAVFALALALAGCDNNAGNNLVNAAKLGAGVESDFVIKVDGTPKMHVTGNIMVVTGAGTSTQKSMEGPLPFEVTTRGVIVSASFQKGQDKGDLVAIVLKDGKEVTRSDTNAKFGMVSVATQ
jgi:hypothetical protein